MDLTQLSSRLKIKTDFNAGSSLGLRDINSITGIVDNSVTSLQALIFKNASPQYDDIDTTNFDITGIYSGYDNVAFVFDLKKEYKLSLSSDITDHYVEDNVAIQDHIGLKPIILDVVGSISEINLIDTEIDKVKESKENRIFNAIDSYSSRMGSLTSFAPNIVNQARDIYDSAKDVYNTASKTFNFIKDPTGKNKKPTGSGFAYTESYNKESIYKSKQFQWIDWFKTQWEHRASFSIVTPYGILNDMYIMELNASQPENTRYVTNLNIKFKQIRKAIVVMSGTKVSQPMEIQKTKTFSEKDIKTIGEKKVKDWYGSDTTGIGENQKTQGLTNINADIKNNPYAVSTSNNTAVSSYNVAPETQGEKFFTNYQLQENLKGFGNITGYRNITGQA